MYRRSCETVLKERGNLLTKVTHHLSRFFKNPTEKFMSALQKVWLENRRIRIEYLMHQFAMCAPVVFASDIPSFLSFELFLPSITYTMLLLRLSQSPTK